MRIPRIHQRVPFAANRSEGKVAKRLRSGQSGFVQSSEPTSSSSSPIISVRTDKPLEFDHSLTPYGDLLQLTSPKDHLYPLGSNEIQLPGLGTYEIPSPHVVVTEIPRGVPALSRHMNYTSAHRPYLPLPSLMERAAQPWVLILKQHLKRIPNLAMMFWKWSHVAAREPVYFGDHLAIYSDISRVRGGYRNEKLNLIITLSFQGYKISSSANASQFDLHPDQQVFEFQAMTIVTNTPPETLRKESQDQEAFLNYHGVPNREGVADFYRTRLGETCLEGCLEHASWAPGLDFLIGQQDQGGTPFGILHFSDDWPIFPDHFGIVPALYLAKMVAERLAMEAIRRGQLSIEHFARIHLKRVGKGEFHFPILSKDFALVGIGDPKFSGDFTRVRTPEARIFLPKRPTEMPGEQVAVAFKDFEIELEAP